ncbi:hypothetical protein [Pseudokineococcus sp. 1T1Z-3]|uniref:hypothetical protein n=1 Tax=Pseudokineococcus sp. 1T1Z-3 TaxID=3132745 RepID=UPI0030984A81
MTAVTDDDVLARSLLDGTAGWWSSAALTVRHDGGLLPEGAARLLLRRPLMGVPAGVRVEDVSGAVLAQGLGPELADQSTRADVGHDLGALLDPLALATGLPAAAGAVPSSERQAAAASLEVVSVNEVTCDDEPALLVVVRGLPVPGVDQHGDDDATSLVLHRETGLPMEVGTSGGMSRLALRVEQLGERLDDEVFTA